jgi:glyoxylase-like metal-dependent hydrolase (beta-lactamase superfamily II)
MPASHRLGNLHLRILSDGTYYQDAGAVFGIVPRIMWERLGFTLNARHQMALGLNSLLVRSHGKNVLIETGVGEKERPLGQTERRNGTLVDELHRVGVAPGEIDVVINTHLHADHCGWNTRRQQDGSWTATFPRARYLIQRAEWEAAINPNERTRATYLAENMRPLEESGQLELVDGERAVTEEITIVPAFGHSMGHAIVVLSSGGESAVYIGDMAQHPAQLERFAWVSSFDIYPLEAMETKRGVIERAIAERQLVVAVHADFPGLGRMMETDGKRKWVQVEANETMDGV